MKRIITLGLSALLLIALVALTNGCGGGTSGSPLVQTQDIGFSLAITDVNTGNGVETAQQPDTYKVVVGQTVKIQDVWIPVKPTGELKRETESEIALSAPMQAPQTRTIVRGGPAVLGDFTTVICKQPGTFKATIKYSLAGTTKTWSKTVTLIVDYKMNLVIKKAGLNGTTDYPIDDQGRYVVTVGDTIVYYTSWEGAGIGIDPYRPEIIGYSCSTMGDPIFGVPQSSTMRRIIAPGEGTLTIEATRQSTGHKWYASARFIAKVSTEITLTITRAADNKEIPLTNNSLWVLNGARFNIKASRVGWEGAKQEIVIFNDDNSKPSPPLMVGDDFIQGLMSGTGDGTVRVMLRRPSNLNDYVYVDFHVYVIDGLGFSK